MPPPTHPTPPPPGIPTRYESTGLFDIPRKPVFPQFLHGFNMRNLAKVVGREGGGAYYYYYYYDGSSSSCYYHCDKTQVRAWNPTNPLAWRFPDPVMNTSRSHILKQPNPHGLILGDLVQDTLYNFFGEKVRVYDNHHAICCPKGPQTHKSCVCIYIYTYLNLYTHTCPQFVPR